jgi:phosphatidylglycerophosphate synthase
VCWLRAALLAAAAAAAVRSAPVAAWWLASASLALDGLDGLLARRLGQVGGQHGCGLFV